MALTPEQHGALVKHLNSKWKNHKCRQCDANSWAIDGVVQLSLSNSPGALVIGGANLPTAALTCRNCGNTLLVNLVISGVVVGGGGT